MAFCEKCGAQLQEGAKFCAGCGAPVEENVQQSNASEQSAQPNQPYQQPVQPNESYQQYQQPAQPNQSYQQPNQQYQQPAQPNFFQKMNDTPDTTFEYDPQDIANNKVMAVLSYLGILVLIPWFAAPQSRFARFHAKQGITLFLVQIAYSVLSVLLGLIKTPHYYYFFEYMATPWYINLLIFLIGIPVFVLTILGIVNAARGLAKELPIIGKIKIVK